MAESPDPRDRRKPTLHYSRPESLEPTSRREERDAKAIGVQLGIIAIFAAAVFPCMVLDLWPTVDTRLFLLIPVLAVAAALVSPIVNRKRRRKHLWAITLSASATSFLLASLVLATGLALLIATICSTM